MKKSILVATVLAFTVMSAGPASAVRGKEEKGAKSAAKAGAVASDKSVQSKSGVQAKSSAANKAQTANKSANTMAK